MTYDEDRLAEDAQPDEPAAEDPPSNFVDLPGQVTRASSYGEGDTGTAGMVTGTGDPMGVPSAGSDPDEDAGSD